MRYYRAKEQIERENAFFRVYAARGLQLITEYTAGFVGGKQGLADYQKALHPEPQMSGEEIAAEVILKAGLKMNEST